MVTRFSLLAFFALLGFTLPRALAPSMAWHEAVGAAFADAEERSAPVFVAINMDGERANDEAVTELYRDKTLLTLAAHTAPLFSSRFDHGGGSRSCTRAPGDVTCEQHMAIEKEIRKRYLEGQGEAVIAPQHLFIGPDGEMLLSVPYRISAGELEWCFVEAIRRLDPAFEWKLSDAARAPKRLVVNGVRTTAIDDAAPPLTKKEVLELIKELKKVPMRDLNEREADVFQVLRSPESKAIDFIGSILTAGGGGGGRGPGGGGRGPGGGGGRFLTQRKVRLLQAIAKYSPPEYYEIVTPLLIDTGAEVRSNAAVALELLQPIKAMPSLTKALKKEEEDDVRRELIRAIASCGRDGKGRTPVQKTWTRKKEGMNVRASAVIGSAYLEDRESVVDLARSAVLSPEPELRAAAAYVIGSRREAELSQLLEEVLLDEKDAATKKALESALAVLQGGDATILDAVARDATGSNLPRERL